MNVLCVAAHPDDETIGCGGTLARHAEAGDDVKVIFHTDGISSRKPNDGNAINSREVECLKALRVLSVASWRYGNFYDQEMDRESIKKVADCVKDCIDMFHPDVIYTHWPHDLNQDHRVVAKATLIATRTWAAGVSRLLAFEVPESTGQAFASRRFAPNFYVDITAHVDRKCKALACYESELRHAPHPRSEIMVRAKAAVRGSEAGCMYAEAFVLLREVVR